MVTVTSAFGPDPLEGYYHPHGPRATGWLAVARVLALTAAGGTAGWVSSQAWTGELAPAYGFVVFFWLAAMCVPTLSARMSYVIVRSSMYRTIACACILMEASVAPAYEPAHTTQEL